MHRRYNVDEEEKQPSCPPYRNMIQKIPGPFSFNMFDEYNPEYVADALKCAGISPVCSAKSQSY